MATSRKKKRLSVYRRYQGQRFEHIVRNFGSDEVPRVESKIKKQNLRSAVSTAVRSQTEFMFTSGALEQISIDVQCFSSLNSIETVTVHFAEDRTLEENNKEYVKMNICLGSIYGDVRITLLFNRVLYIRKQQ